MLRGTRLVYWQLQCVNAEPEKEDQNIHESYNDMLPSIIRLIYFFFTYQLNNSHFCWIIFSYGSILVLMWDKMFYNV